ncbi:hypothetical protein EXIGLDRAFT_737503 [Exidia glandulosa HHB12029]|uniref:Uncharacterized protein n=1 Tax=Exidia glandulosa HHB12029 TaxID=1314781 RepID=A0A165IYB0_EXIGL|nr:hypothetical protein EXIGLDRAFT_737503 [Exidia glandulosa HHB12029]
MIDPFQDDEPQAMYAPRKDSLVRDSMAPSPSPEPRSPPPREVYSPRPTFRTKVVTKAKSKAKTIAKTSPSVRLRACLRIYYERSHQPSLASRRTPRSSASSTHATYKISQSNPTRPRSREP